MLRLGWAHGDDEIISTEQAIAWFDLPGIGKGPARFDFAKLDSLNAHYLRETPDGRLLDLIRPQLEARLDIVLSDQDQARLLAAMAGLKPRAKTLVELAENAVFYVTPRPLALDDKAAKALTPEARHMLGRLSERLADLAEWTEEAVEAEVRGLAEAESQKLGKIAQPLRAALCGTLVSPGIFEVMQVLGRDESLARIHDAIEGNPHGSMP